MNFIPKRLLAWARKTLLSSSVFSTTTQNATWYKRNGYGDLADAYGAGVDEAFTLAACYGAIRIISEDLGRLPCKPYRETGNNRFEEAKDHWSYDRLVISPNPEMTPMEFRETLTAQALLYGNGYARKVFQGSTDKVLALWPMDPTMVKVEAGSGSPNKYSVRSTKSGVWVPVDSREIFHLRGFGLDGVTGLNVLSLARRAINLAIAQENYAANYFDSDRTPGVLLETTEALEPEQVEGIKAAWRAKVQSQDVGVLTGGLKANMVGRTNVDSQLVEQRLFELQNVCRYWRISPAKLGDLSRSTYSNQEQVAVEYNTETLGPWMVRWEQTIQRCLLNNDRSLVVRHTENALMRADFKTQTDGFARLLEKGVYSINEVRAYLHMNPIDGGDEHFIQLNMQDVANAGAAAAAVTGGLDAQT